jgi:hypothetical protein
VRPLVVVLATAALAGCAGGNARQHSEPLPPASLYLAGDGVLTIVDVDAGYVEEMALSELAPGDPAHRIVRRGDRLVFWGRDTFVVDADVGTPPRRLGDSWFFVPSAHPERVWLARLDPGSPDTVRALAGLTETAVDGRVTVAHVRPPAGRWPVAAVGDALVFERRRGGLELWEPSSGAFTQRLPGAVLGPSQGDFLGWCEGEDGPLHVTNVRAGSDRLVAVPAGFVAFDCPRGAFSPTGDFLAIAMRSSRLLDSPRTLVLVDLDTGERDVVEGSTVGPDYVFVAWSRGGERVFVSGARGDRRELVEYRPGAARATPLQLDVAPFYGMAAR